LLVCGLKRLVDRLIFDEFVDGESGQRNRPCDNF
jgi:hypothetical protein